MTEASQSDSDQEEQAVSTLPKPGAMLRVQRETSGISHAMVAEALHLTVHYVKALENDEYAKLPGFTFVKGYIRSYARFLQMDVDTVLSCYEGYIKELGDQVSEKELSSRIRKRNDQVVIWAIIAGLILVAGLAALWWFFGRDSNNTSAAASKLPAVITSTGTNSAGIRPSDTTVAIVDNASTELVAGTVNDTTLESTGSDEYGYVEEYDYVDESTDEALAEAAVAVGLETGALEVDVTASAEPAVLEVVAETGIEQNEVEQTEIEQTEIEQNEVGQEGLGQEGPAPEGSNPDDIQTDSAVDPQDETGNMPASSVDTEAAQASAVNGYTETIGRTATGSRRVQLLGEGEDMLQLSFKGNSWVEVDDSAEVRLYNDLMRLGDALVIQGAAPFYVLLGDATQVDINFNAQVIDFSNRVRDDKSARFIISDTGANRWVAR